ncbi:DUF2807 domain-containing protein [Devosia sp. A8/3-2]|nr:DUF2807 domain-containing protein [Devosia sp. A8/3-2]
MRSIATLALATAIGLTFGGAAMAESHDFELNNFDRIDIATGLDAVVTIGDSFAVRAESGSADALSNLELSVADGVLTARIDQDFLDFIISGGLVGMLLNSGNAVTINITLPALSGISASSGADVRATALKSEQLDLEASSGADIKLTGAAFGALRAGASSGANIDLSGTCNTIEAEASSGSGIDAGDSVCATATAGASSGADIAVHATQSVKAEASSGGDIDVQGNPAQTDFDSSSGGDISFDD